MFKQTDTQQHLAHTKSNKQACKASYSSSLLSTLSSLFTLASTLHVSTSHHTTIVSLQELSCLVECVELLALLSLFLVHNSFECFTLSALFDSFGPLLTNLTEVVFSVLAIRLCLHLLFCLFTHLGIVRVQSLSVLLVCTIVLGEKLPLSKLILTLTCSKLLLELLNCLI